MQTLGKIQQRNVYTIVETQEIREKVWKKWQETFEQNKLHGEGVQTPFLVQKALQLLSSSN